MSKTFKTSTLITGPNLRLHSPDLIGKIEVKSKQQPRLSLGRYSEVNPPKGFAVHIDPEPDPDAVVTQIISLGTDKEYELVLYIANYGNITLSAEVWNF